MIALLLLWALQDDWESLRAGLASEDARTRAQAQEQLNKITDRKELKKRIAAESDPEVKSALQNALEALPILKLTVEVVGESKVGRIPTYKVRIKNVSDEPVVVVRSLDGSGMKNRYPHFFAEFFDGEAPIKLEPPMGCGNCNEIAAADLATLKPDEEFDPFQSGSFGVPDLQTWQPSRPGKYTVKIICDYQAPELAHFNGPIERMNGIGGLEGELKKVPKVRIEGKAEFEVKP